MPNLTGADVEEFEALNELTKLGGWKYVRKLLSDHRGFCLSKSRDLLKKHDDRKAGEWLAKSEEPQRILELILNRKKELANKMEGE